ncbi:MAG: asparaginase [Planctomycetaceae bacterium]|nr:asparaginase [Planctomycetaceae bacterium]
MSADTMNTNQPVRFLAVGGTIDKIYFDSLSEYQVGAPGVERILSELPVTFEYTVQSVLRKDSLDMTDADRKLVLQAVVDSPEDRIVITHGTDTMVETARLLQAASEKCIVLTGAMQPAGFSNSDAVFNIGVAIGAVQSRPNGVWIAMSGRVFDAAHVRKNRDKGIFEDVPAEAG